MELESNQNSVFLEIIPMHDQMKIDLNWTMKELHETILTRFNMEDQMLRLVLWDEENKQIINYPEYQSRRFTLSNFGADCRIRNLKDEYIKVLKEHNLRTDLWAVLVSPKSDPLPIDHEIYEHMDRKLDFVNRQDSVIIQKPEKDENRKLDRKLDFVNRQDSVIIQKPEKDENRKLDRKLDFVNRQDSVIIQKPEKDENVLRGLVNQAMTCYLNSLLQALYMTPEFRNALYKWEYVESPGDDESMNIPFQLQKLFLNLQTADKVSVETTALTRSFGWDSTEIWQQHDIQELCRVMFDALEQKFENTEQANLISQLYEGKMIDYVKCLECNTEKSREDKFLDIPLPVRPFGSNVAYNSIEEALKAFVKHELLDGNNQYFCEKCNKKCDAHKGLKFTKFPYLVTIHLKRFDFDYQSLHRIKLNDKVTFPEELDLNPFIDSADSLSQEEEDASTNNVKLENGTTEEDCSPCNENGDESNESNKDQNDETDSNISNDNRNCISKPKGPYVYELFAIMIHSGSTSGGHYYAYIKDFTTQEWFCFNDQTVSKITKEDIIKIYGGGPARTTSYSGAYNTSTNAYMLMYRQIDPKLNATPLKKEEFPEHIKKLLPKLEEENSTSNCHLSGQLRDQVVSVYCVNAKTNVMEEVRLQIRKRWTWEDVVMKTFRELDIKLGDNTLRSNIQLFEYNKETKAPIIENRISLTSIVDYFTTSVIILFKKIQKPCHLSDEVLIIQLDVDSGKCVGLPRRPKIVLNLTIDKLKLLLTQYNIEPSTLHVVGKFGDSFELLQDDMSLYDIYDSKELKLFVANKLDPNPEKTNFKTSKLIQLCRLYDNLQYVLVYATICDEARLASKQIPLSNKTNTMPVLEFNTNESGECLEVNMKALLKELGLWDKMTITSQLELQKSTKEDRSKERKKNYDRNTPEQSNSEDSSLSDSDRTLVGEPPEEENENDGYERQVYQMVKEYDKEKHINIYCFWFITSYNLKIVLKKLLATYFGISSEDFDLCKKYQPTLISEQRFKLVLKRQLEPNEFKVFICHLTRDPKTKEFNDKRCFEDIVQSEMTVRDFIKKINSSVENCDSTTTSNSRLWIKSKPGPYVILPEDAVLEEYRELMQQFHEDDWDIDFQINKVFFQNDCDSQHTLRPTETIVYVRRFYPAQKRCDNVEEIVVEMDNPENIATEIARVRYIPRSRLLFLMLNELRSAVDYSSCQTKLADSSISRLLYSSNESALHWTEHLDSFPNDVHNVIIYRDSGESYPEETSVDHITFNFDTVMVKKNTESAIAWNRRRARAAVLEGSRMRPEKGIKIQVSPNK